VFSGPARKHEIALTFDDGPGPEPPARAFVRLLARQHAPATFFEIGSQIPEYDANGKAERSMLAAGDMIGNHTWSHPVMTALSLEQQREQLERTDRAIRQRTGFTPCLWRPPYGAVNQRLVSAARSLGLLTVMWDVDPRDWSLPGTPAIYSGVVSAAHNGAIILQHFGGGPRYETLAALPKEIHTLRARGYRFVTVAQLLGLKLIYR
jgi:peptidoglycan/xylan/chitin deacetylase (PgdA/CDA1 family)